MTLEAIKAAIAELTETERASLAAWLIRQDAEDWDKQMEADFSEGGPGTPLLESWDAEIKAGGAVPLDEFLSQQEAERRVALA